MPRGLGPGREPGCLGEQPLRAAFQPPCCGEACDIWILDPLHKACLFILWSLALSGSRLDVLVVCFLRHRNRQPCRGSISLRCRVHGGPSGPGNSGPRPSPGAAVLVPRAGVLNRDPFPRVLEAGSPRHRSEWGWFLPRPLSWSADAASSLRPHVVLPLGQRPSHLFS